MNTSGTAMSTALSEEGILPNSDPETGQVATVAVGPGSGFVDYVQIELRDGSSQSTPFANLLATQSGLLKANGDVVALDGISPIAFTGFSNGDYFIAVNHRNHLGTMIALPVALSEITTVVDFISTTTQLYSIETYAPVASIGSSRALYAGDANGDGFVTYRNLFIGGQLRFSDYNEIFQDVIFAQSPTSFSNKLVEYSASDVNLSGEAVITNQFDFSTNPPQLLLSDVAALFDWITLNPVNGSGTFNFISEQLP